MSKRLQVVLDDDELEAIHQIAAAHRMTVSEWVRQVLRMARRQEPRGDLARKLAAIQVASVHSFPTGDIDQMLADIETGYTGPKG